MNHTPIAFMSYVRLDDQHENGRLTQFRDRLSGEVRMQSGDPFQIFQDRNDIAWGQQWQARIDESLDGATFLIPIITPAFFKSPACVAEVERFLDREGKLGRTDLILPVYYVECTALNDEAQLKSNPIVRAVANHQNVDWRELRFEPFTSPQLGQLLAKMARQIVQSLERNHKPPSHSQTRAPTAISAAVLQGADSQKGLKQEGAQATDAGVGRTPAPKTEPRTLVVDALRRGDYSTLSEALKATKPGDRILIRPGLYREGVVIKKPVEIVGDGPRSDIVIEASGRDVVLFQTDMGRISNLTLRQAGGGNWYAVDIAQGRLDLEDCDISSQSLACVAIHSGADPRLRRNSIHDGQSSGVLVIDSAQGTLEDNEIFMNKLANVYISKDSNPTLRRNRIYDSRQGGVFVSDDGRGTLEDNEIIGNGQANVQIASGGNPTLRRNRICDGKQSGVFVFENGLGTLENNEILRNAKAGVYISESGNPTLRGNRISANGCEGVVVKGDAGGVFEKNDLRNNTKAAWDIQAGAESRVSKVANIE